MHIDAGNPPLTRWIQGLAHRGRSVDLGVPRADLATIETSWDLGYRFERAHAADYHEVLVRSRFASLGLFLLLIVGVYIWARSLAGGAAGLASAFLAATCPNLLAHARLVTPDIGTSAALVWAGYAAFECGRRPSLLGAALAGALAGATCLCKFSGFVALPFLFAFAVAPRRHPHQKMPRALAFTIAALAPLFAAYGTLQVGSWGSIPLPLPAPLVDGFRAQLNEAPYPAYLFGEVREGGWLLYYAVAFLFKTPLAVLALWGMATWSAFRRRQDTTFLPLLVAGALFLAIGFATKKNVGIRYLLPVFPLLAVAVAPLFARRNGRAPRIALALLATSVASGVFASGAPLSFFNGLEKFFGGKRQVLVDSNLDWGQGLQELRDWMKKEEIPVIQLAYFGRVDPVIYGVAYRSLSGEPTSGPAAISATLSVGRPYVMRWRDRPFVEPEIAWTGEGTWSWTRGLKPDAELAGGSILVFKNIGSGLPEIAPPGRE